MGNEKQAMIVLAVSLSVMILLASGCAKKNAFSYDEKDQCGVALGSFMNIIKDEDSCRQKCFSGCLSRQMNFDKSEFLLSGDAPCNKCTCFCRE
jgi:hypothetical protein